MMAGGVGNARALAENLVNQGYEVTTANDAAWILRKRRRRGDVVVTIVIQSAPAPAGPPATAPPPPAGSPWGPPSGPAR